MSFRKCVAQGAFALCLSWQLLGTNVAMAREKGPRDQAEAIRWAEEALKATGSCDAPRVDSQYIVCGHSFGIALARVVSVGTNYDNAGGFPHFYVTWQDYAHDQQESVAWARAVISFSNAAIRYHERFRMALEFLAANARPEASENEAREFVQFQAQARAWRDAAVKPPMPEAAHEHQVLAEYAFKEKDTDKAINEYTAALDVYPYWPEGQFNLATLAGEKKLYAVAVFHMKEYLELVPDSPDTQAAKDSVIIWRDKLQTLQTAVNSNVSASASGSMFQQVSRDRK
jgi:tetratricopeptide (TPR) repeat protein